MAKSQGIAPPFIIDQAAMVTSQHHTSRRKGHADEAAHPLLPAAQLAHEMKTSLSVILYRAHMLADTAGGLSATQQRYVAQIIQAGEEMQATIEHMQDVALGEVGAIALEREQVVPAALIETVVAQLMPLAEEKCQRLSVNISANLPTLTGDRARLHQILSNLIANAIKFTREGGTIDIGAQRGPDNAVDFFVRDNGPGIAKKHQAAIFQPFYRVHPAQTPGTGLGLALAYQLAHLHHGTIWVESRWHKGSTFWVRIPDGTTTTSS